MIAVRDEAPIVIPAMRRTRCVGESGDDGPRTVDVFLQGNQQVPLPHEGRHTDSKRPE